MKKILLATTLTILALVTAFFTAKISVDKILIDFDLSTKVIWDMARSQKTLDRDMYILALGIGGSEHEGPLLTDSMMLVRIAKDYKSIKALSIPRDIWDPNIKDKVNTYLTYASEQQPKNINGYITDKFGGLSGIRPGKIIIINFANFIQVIDLLGGIDVTVAKQFVDTEFPITGLENKDCVPYDPDFKCRYKTITFAKGPNHLSGERALEYVRSRHSGDLEAGTDFARAARQHLVIKAIMDKVVSLAKNLEFAKLLAVARFLDANITRNITNQEVLEIAKEIYTKRKDLKFKQSAIPETLLKVGEYVDYDNRYVLVPSQEGKTMQEVFEMSMK